MENIKSLAALVSHLFALHRRAASADIEAHSKVRYNIIVHVSYGAVRFFFYFFSLYIFSWVFPLGISTPARSDFRVCSDLKKSTFNVI